MNNNFISNAAKKILVVCMIDISPSTLRKDEASEETINQLINKHLHTFIKQLEDNRKIKTSAEICFITYSTHIEVRDFTPLKTLVNNVPYFNAVEIGGTRTYHAIDKGYNTLKERISVIGKLADIYTPVVFLITDGDAVHDSESYRKEVTEMVNKATVATNTKDKAIPIIVGVGNQISDVMKNQLCELTKGFTDGFFHLSSDQDLEPQFKDLFSFIGSSIIASTNNINTEDLIRDLDVLIKEKYEHLLYIPR